MVKKQDIEINPQMALGIDHSLELGFCGYLCNSPNNVISIFELMPQYEEIHGKSVDLTHTHTRNLETPFAGFLQTNI